MPSRRARSAGVAIAAGVMAAGCGAPRDGVRQTVGSQEPAPSPEVGFSIERAPPGALVLLARSEQGGSDLYLLTRGRMERLTHSPPPSGFGTLDGSGRRLVATRLGGTPDRIVRYSLRDGRLLDRGGAGRGSGPAIDRRGRVLSIDTAAAPPRIRVAGRKSRYITVSGEIGSVGWLPRGRVVAETVVRGRSRLVLGAGSRRRRTVRTGLTDHGTLAVGRDGRIAYGYAGAFVVFDPRGRVVRRLRIPWYPVAWSPAASRLLIANQRGELATLDRRGRDLILIGRAIDGAVVDAAWLPQPKR